MIVRFRAIGSWQPNQVIVRAVAGTRQTIPEVEAAIERAWTGARGRNGLKLFDGPMCRLERFVAGKTLQLDLSQTSYRIFWGTNLNNAALAKTHGPQVMADSVGLSCALESADGLLLLGRRNATVAYYPSRVHPFAGALEPGDPIDIFAEARRELFEELALGPDDITQLACIAIIQDAAILQPELILAAKSARSRREIEARLDPAEHDSLVAIEPTTARVESILRDPILTPVAAGTVLLWGREHFGPAWFDAAQQAVNLRES